MNTERGVFLEKHDGFRNGFYERRMKTKFGGIDDFAVPRDREGNYRTAVFEPILIELRELTGRFLK